MVKVVGKSVVGKSLRCLMLSLMVDISKARTCRNRAHPRIPLQYHDFGDSIDLRILLNLLYYLVHG